MGGSTESMESYATNPRRWIAAWGGSDTRRKTARCCAGGATGSNPTRRIPRCSCGWRNTWQQRHRDQRGSRNEPGAGPAPVRLPPRVRLCGGSRNPPAYPVGRAGTGHQHVSARRIIGADEQIVLMSRPGANMPRSHVSARAVKSPLAGVPVNPQRLGKRELTACPLCVGGPPVLGSDAVAVGAARSERAEVAQASHVRGGACLGPGQRDLGVRPHARHCAEKR